MEETEQLLLKKADLSHLEKSLLKIIC